MPTPFDLLSAVRITALIQELQDQRTLPGNLLGLSRTPITPAIDAEIMGSFTGALQIADLVADDAHAVTYSAGRFTLTGNAVPNLKLGQHMSQAMLNHLQAFASRSGDLRDDVGFLNWENRTITNLLTGIDWRMESLIVAMWLDGFSYDRLGIKMSNVSWGMPSDLKVMTATAWQANPTTATPVEDILAIKLLASTRYGIMYDRLTMSTALFRAMIATTEFQAKARMFLAPNVSVVNLSLSNLTMQQTLAQNVLGMTIELYDSRYDTQAPDGTISSLPFLPINKIVFSASTDDNAAAVMDFANGIVTESIVAGLVGGFGGLGGGQYGPVAYPTVPADLNPPSVTYWGVARGFPRKHKRAATAVLDVGAMTDPIPTTAPF